MGMAGFDAIRKSTTLAATDIGIASTEANHDVVQSCIALPNSEMMWVAERSHRSRAAAAARVRAIAGGGTIPPSFASVAVPRYMRRRRPACTSASSRRIMGR